MASWADDCRNDPEIKALGLQHRIGVETLEKINPFYNCPIVNAAIESAWLGSFGQEKMTSTPVSQQGSKRPEQLLNNLVGRRWSGVRGHSMGEPANFVSYCGSGLPTLIQAAEGDHTMPNQVQPMPRGVGSGCG